MRPRLAQELPRLALERLFPTYFTILATFASFKKNKGLRTDGPTDTPSYRDARTHLKTGPPNLVNVPVQVFDEVAKPLRTPGVPWPMNVSLPAFVDRAEEPSSSWVNLSQWTFVQRRWCSWTAHGTAVNLKNFTLNESSLNTEAANIKQSKIAYGV